MGIEALVVGWVVAGSVVEVAAEAGIDLVSGSVVKVGAGVSSGAVLKVAPRVSFGVGVDSVQASRDIRIAVVTGSRSFSKPDEPLYVVYRLPFYRQPPHRSSPPSFGGQHPP